MPLLKVNATPLSRQERVLIELLPVDSLAQGMRGAFLWTLCRDLRITPTELKQLVRQLRRRGVDLHGDLEDGGVWMDRRAAKTAYDLLDEG